MAYALRDTTELSVVKEIRQQLLSTLDIKLSRDEHNLNSILSFGTISVIMMVILLKITSEIPYSANTVMNM